LGFENATSERASCIIFNYVGRQRNIDTQIIVVANIGESSHRKPVRQQIENGLYRKNPMGIELGTLRSYRN